MVFRRKNSRADENAVVNEDEDDNDDRVSVDYDDNDENNGGGGGDDDDDDHQTTTDEASSAGLRSSDKFASYENHAVLGSKILVWFVLFVAAVVFGISTFFYLRNEIDNDFESEFKANAREIAAAAEDDALKTASVIRDLSIACTSYVDTTPLEEFPSFTLPHFEARTAEAIKLSGAEVITVTALLDTRTKSEWEDYAVEHQGWIRKSLDYKGLYNVDPGLIPTELYNPPGSEEEAELYYSSAGSEFKTYSPVWQMGPVPTDASVIMQNMAAFQWYRELIFSSASSDSVRLSGIVDLEFLLQYTSAEEDRVDIMGSGDDESRVASRATWDNAKPRSAMILPVWRDFKTNFPGAFVVAVLPWHSYFEDLLPPENKGYIVYVNDGCGYGFTFRIDGRDASYIGQGDLHDSQYNHLAQPFEFATFTRFSLEWVGSLQENTAQFSSCNYTIVIYPSSDLENEYSYKDSYVYSAIVVVVFFFTALVFVLYDYAVQRRNKKVMTTAERTTAIVSSLFPKNVQKRILEEAEEQAKQEAAAKKRGLNFAAKSQLKEFLGEKEANTSTNDYGVFKTKPIAELFPETTIMFADLVGFTAWSSTREPSQVFMLLETIYHAFDEIARKRRVFKVETVGDCYVAVAGLPEPRKDHAVVMARFARDCLHKLNSLTRQLEETLGPDTADLAVRIGLHSGPVTAGVLRGERARFQLFGDTVNTTSRMESNGRPNKIHISQETAELLIAAGKSAWVSLRSDKIVAKGKGQLTTYWLDVRAESQTSTFSGSSESAGASDRGGENTAVNLQEVPVTDAMAPAEIKPDMEKANNARHQRLVNWNTDILVRLLKEVVASRGGTTKVDESIALAEQQLQARKTMVLDEVVEIIKLPNFNGNDKKAAPETVELSEQVVEQLHSYVETISVLYRGNPFHNFEHVSHVTMSVVKLLSRIVAPDLEDDEDAIFRTLHDHTYGITSDPLTQFAVVFSALIHDVDHTGVPNATLIKENARIAQTYKNKSVAEQNSVDIAWDLLMDDNFKELRYTIYTTESEFRRFRQLVVNAVMATDIIDKDLGAARKARWNKAFAEGYTNTESDTADDVNRKATIVIEHLIQASDVAHTMQHWHIYRKWNTRLFEEMYRAYVSGRSDKDPSAMWYEGEMGFFDFYIIPLAKKLKDCGVFGVSSDEYLTYAQQNRKEWEHRGQEVVAEMLEDMKRKGLSK